MTGTLGEHVVDDPRFGEVVLRADDDLVAVDGARLPALSLRRRGGPQNRPRSHRPPIGTRDPDRLELTGDGGAWTLEIGPGRLARSSYRLRAHRDGRTLTLTPCDPYSSRLVRGARRRRPELGRLTRAPDGGVGAAWRTAADPTPEEAALGYLLAAAFDTGAELAVVALVGGGGDLAVPG